MAISKNFYIKKIESLSYEKAQNTAQLEIAQKIQNGIIPEEMNISEDEAPVDLISYQQSAYTKS